MIFVIRNNQHHDYNLLDWVQFNWDWKNFALKIFQNQTYFVETKKIALLFSYENINFFPHSFEFDPKNKELISIKNRFANEHMNTISMLLHKYEVFFQCDRNKFTKCTVLLFYSTLKVIWFYIMSIFGKLTSTTTTTATAKIGKLDFVVFFYYWTNFPCLVKSNGRKKLTLHLCWKHLCWQQISTWFYSLFKEKSRVREKEKIEWMNMFA